MVTEFFLALIFSTPTAFHSKILTGFIRISSDWQVPTDLIFQYIHLFILCFKRIDTADKLSVVYYSCMYIYIINLKEWWFTKITVKVSDDVRNLSFISQCLGYLFLLVKDTIKNILYYCNFRYICYPYLHTSWKGIFHCVWFMCFHGLHCDARAEQIPCSLYCFQFISDW